MEEPSKKKKNVPEERSEKMLRRARKGRKKCGEKQKEKKNLIEHKRLSGRGVWSTSIEQAEQDGESGTMKVRPNDRADTVCVHGQCAAGIGRIMGFSAASEMQDLLVRSAVPSSQVSRTNRDH